MNTHIRVRGCDAEAIRRVGDMFEPPASNREVIESTVGQMSDDEIIDLVARRRVSTAEGMIQ